MTQQEQIAAMSEVWRTGISDPPIEPRTLWNLLRKYGHPIVVYAVQKTIARYHRGGIDFDACCRYLAATARNRSEQVERAKEFVPPVEWLRQ